MAENTTTQTSSTTDGVKTNEENKSGDAEKTFNQDELNKVVSKRLNEAKADWEKTMSEKIATERADAERLANLSADEKQKELLAKQQKENETTLKNLTIRENRIEASTKLIELKIPVSFVDLLVHEDKGIMETRITQFNDEFQKAVSTAVAEKTKGTAPIDVKTNNSKTPTPANFF